MPKQIQGGKEKNRVKTNPWKVPYVEAGILVASLSSGGTLAFSRPSSVPLRNRMNPDARGSGRGASKGGFWAHGNLSCLAEFVPCLLEKDPLDYSRRLFRIL